MMHGQKNIKKYNYIHQTKHVMDPTGFRRGVNDILALLGHYAA